MTWVTEHEYRELGRSWAECEDKTMIIFGQRDVEVGICYVVARYFFEILTKDLLWSLVQPHAG